MTAYDGLKIGDQHYGAPMTVDAGMVATVVELAGYVHPLFTDLSHTAVGPFPGPPIPGGMLLMLLGGMAESLPAFDDHVLALMGYDTVRFEHPATVGALLTATFTLIALEPAPSGRGGTAVWDWELHREDGERVCHARARLRNR